MKGSQAGSKSLPLARDAHAVRALEIYRLRGIRYAALRAARYIRLRRTRGYEPSARSRDISSSHDAIYPALPDIKRNTKTFLLHFPLREIICDYGIKLCGNLREVPVQIKRFYTNLITAHLIAVVRLNCLICRCIQKHA